jgi:hypothetical protein
MKNKTMINTKPQAEINTVLAAGAPNPKLSTDSTALDCVSEKRGLAIGATSKPILFSTEMILAILAGRKTQTRRIIKPQPIGDITYFKGEIWTDEPDVITSPTIKCPYGQKGDILWVRETWQKRNEKAIQMGFEKYYYKAGWDGCSDAGWKPSIFMPREACRIELKILNIRTERICDISEDDAKAEGIKELGIYSFPIYKDYLETGVDGFQSGVNSFYSLWKSINGIDSLKDNSVVWVIEFERLQK